MNNKQTDKHILESKTIWKSTKKLAEIAKKIKTVKLLEHNNSTKKRTT